MGKCLSREKRPQSLQRILRAIGGNKRYVTWNQRTYAHGGMTRAGMLKCVAPAGVTMTSHKLMSALDNTLSL
ncbi:hypothetical protein FH972_022997 [Carpinus fangiana]|uniref:Uncharacterized protein n=1 Tax=Carpinus fangiana TaxID=176857 RepID=A0A5N6KW54_9ROSI|nr:hypothetical protein FH972_022997 [Carpinus fangiana]